MFPCALSACACTFNVQFSTLSRQIMNVLQQIIVMLHITVVIWAPQHHQTATHCCALAWIRRC
jgi:hypothetical protein